jgi:phosphopantothenoylcysteine decarboxylase/phosphopantothenate--cysteine ligase
MGAAIAAAAQRRGADVTLILGPSSVSRPVGVTVLGIETALDMRRALGESIKGADIVVMTAAVADYRVAKPAKDKLKRGKLGGKLALELVANPDLLAELGKQRKGKSPVLVGFAAETQDVVANAEAKLVTKGCDLIVANDVSEAGSGFSTDTNRVTLVDKTGATELPQAPKSVVAHRILDRVVALLPKKR